MRGGTYMSASKAIRPGVLDWRQANALNEMGRGTERIAFAALNVRNVRCPTSEVVG